jgi:hypothetical protein
MASVAGAVGLVCGFAGDILDSGCPHPLGTVMRIANVSVPNR